MDSEELPQRKKTTSFKITNVFLSRPPSNDGDESNEDCEDLEDSHTEVRNISNVILGFIISVRRPPPPPSPSKLYPSPPMRLYLMNPYALFLPLIFPFLQDFTLVTSVLPLSFSFICLIFFTIVTSPLSDFILK